MIFFVHFYAKYLVVKVQLNVEGILVVINLLTYNDVAENATEVDVFLGVYVQKVAFVYRFVVGVVKDLIDYYIFIGVCGPE